MHPSSPWKFWRFRLGRKAVLLLLLAFAVSAASAAFAADINVVNHGDDWMYREGTNAPQSDWKTVTDAGLDGTWLGPAPGGFGYGDGDDATVLTNMQHNYTTVYIRRTFTIASPVDTNLSLALKMDWDDGFVAWLDGVELQRQNADNTPAGTEPPYDDVALPENHEAGTVVDFNFGLVSNRLGVGDHVLAVMGLNDSDDSSDLSLIADLYLTDSRPPVPDIIAVDTTWTVAGSPYELIRDTVVAADATLTIQPGVSVFLDPDVSLTVNGRLLAEGSFENRILFSRNSTNGPWDRLWFFANTLTSRLVHVDMSYCGGDAIEATGTTLFLDDVAWGHSTASVLDLVDCSITLLNSMIPGGQGNEPIHFVDMPVNGHALIQDCVFDAPSGYSDSVDFTGGNRPGPIVQFIDNVFLGGVDDCLDMDGCDAHIEGNVFLNIRKDASRASSSNPMSTGANGSDLSELVICRNIIYDCEHALLEKDYGTALLQNNTFVRLTDNPLSTNTGEDPGIILFGEPWRSDPFGGGVVFEGNIGSGLQVTDAFPLQVEAETANAGFFFVRTANCIQGFDLSGTGNINADPLFVDTNAVTADNIRQKLALQSGSPCIGTGPNGLDMGALVPAGASVSGAPTGTTDAVDAVLTVAGPGIWAYRWRLDGGAWSGDVSLVPQTIWDGQPFRADMLSAGVPIVLSNLGDGLHTVEVIGRNSAGVWQNTNMAVTVSWTVQGVARPRISATRPQGVGIALDFEARAGQSYSLLKADAFPGQIWMEADRVAPVPSNRTQTVIDADARSSGSRFYRVVSPARE